MNTINEEDENIKNNELFHTLENKFQEVFMNIQQDENLESFRLEYEKLYQNLKQSRDNELKLSSQRIEIRNEIIQNQINIKKSLGFAFDENISLEDLKQSIIQSSNWTNEQLEMKNNYEKEIIFLKNQLDNKMNNLQKVKDENNQIFNEIEKWKLSIENNDKLNNNILNDIKLLQKDIKRKTNIKEINEKNLYKLCDDISNLNNVFDNKQEEYKLEEKILANITKTIEDIKIQMSSNIDNYMKLQHDLDMKSNDIDNQSNLINKLQQEIQERKDYIDNKSNEMNITLKDIEKYKSYKIVIQKKLDVIELERNQIEEMKNKLTFDISHLENYGHVEVCY